MTAPTHIIFSALFSSLSTADYWQTAACALGSLLPDLDHPRSSIGRVFFFVSHPLNMCCGHRGLIHSVFLWFPLLLLGILLKSLRLQWLAIGALSHVLLDCYNTSGVRALTPFSGKTVVLFKRDWRVGAGSLGEIYVFMAIAALLPVVHYTQTIGGPRKLINRFVRSPIITAEEFQRAGNLRCYAKGEWRWNDGRIEQVDWLVVGTEANWLVMYDGKKLIKKKHGEFLRSTLKQTAESWNPIKVNRIVTVKQAALFFDGKIWHFAQPGERALGIIKPLDNVLLEIEP